MEEATAHFQLLNNAYPYLREVMWCQNCSLQMQPIQKEYIVGKSKIFSLNSALPTLSLVYFALAAL